MQTLQCNTMYSTIHTQYSVLNILVIVCERITEVGGGNPNGIINMFN